jgi:anti-anti-sigma regulatory factor
MIVKLKEFGESLGSRVLGKEVSNMIGFEKEDEIILDFDEVKMITSSFADEVIGKNCAKLGLHNFFKKVQIINTSEQIKLILKKAIIDRLVEKHEIQEQ